MKDQQKEANWQLLGRLVAKIVALFTLVRNTFAEAGVGIDIVGWVLGDGKEVFVKSMKALGEQYMQTQRWRTVDENTIEVNLDASPRLPFDGAALEWPKSSGQKKGWVKLQLRDGKLFLDGKEIILLLEEGQKTSYVVGHELRKALEGKNALHPNVLDALFENAHLIPKSWKVDEQGRTRFIYFWAAGFRGSHGHLCVRYLYFDDGSWGRSFGWLGHDWSVRSPAAVLAS